MQLKEKSLLRDEAYSQIKKMIISGELDNHTVLYETSLAKIMGMSRTPIREALMRLGEDGMVKYLSNRGFLVATPTIQEVEEIFDLRICLEKYVIEEIFSRQIPLNLTSLKNILKEHSKALKNRDFWGFFESNRQFHLEFVGFLGNKTLVDVVQSLRDKPLQSGFYALRNNARLLDAYNEHAAILEALEKRDKEAATAEIVRHTTNSRKRLMGLNYDE